MKLGDILKEMEMTPVTGELVNDPEVTSVYICDLLSRVMSKGEKNAIWITVLSHINIIAVAQLAELACIVIPENIPVQADTVEKAKEEGVVILTSPLSSYEISCKIHKITGI